MKIEAIVIGVERWGDSLMVRADGRVVGMAEWRPDLELKFGVPDTDDAGRAYYVGRKLAIEIKPR